LDFRWRAWSAALCAVLIGAACAADYVFNGALNLGTGYRDTELLGQTAAGDKGQKFVEKIIGSGRFRERSAFELDVIKNTINFTQDAEFEYFPVSYGGGAYNRKWSNRICVINYDAGSVLTEVYTASELIHRSTEIRTTGAAGNESLQAGMDATFIGSGRIAWTTHQRNDKRAVELSRSVEELTGAFSVKKYVDLSNRSGRPSRVDWIPCA